MVVGFVVVPERLDASGEAENARRAHALSYPTLAEAAQPQTPVRAQGEWRWTRLEQEHDNLGAARRL